MCEFRCPNCSNTGEFITSRYETWVSHILSNEHQLEVRKRQNVRERWKNEENSFVLTGIAQTEGLPWSLIELGEWISSFGTLTQFLYNDKHCFCVFTVEGFGPKGREQALSITSQQEFKGYPIQIKPKSSYDNKLWNFVYQIGEASHPTQSAPSKSQDTLNSPKLKNEQMATKAAFASTTSVPKGTLVFTNKNQSSSSYQQAPKSANSNNNNNNNKESSKISINNSNFVDNSNPSKSGSGTSTSSTSISTVGVAEEGLPISRRGKQNKKKTRLKLQLDRESAAESSSSNNHNKTDRESTPRASSGMAVPPSSLVPHDQKMKSSPPEIPSFNFRGGFNPSGRKGPEYRVSESSDSSAKPEAPASTSSSSTPKPSSQHVQIQQRPSTSNDSTSENFKKQKHNGAVTYSQSSSSRRGDRYKNQPAGGMPPHKSRPYQQQQLPQFPQQYLLSPIFTSQISPSLVKSLSNPVVPTSKNPYKFDNMPPFPYFFDLFQKLPDEKFQPQKDILCKHFQKLQLAQQLEEFFIAQTLPFEEIRLRWQVIFDILFILRQEFPRCEVYAFGSVLTGLGDFMSDIDIYVDLIGESTSPQPIDPAHRMNGHEAVDTVKKILRKSICPHNKNRFVKQLIPVKSARVPILKITHMSTLINCDLSFENRLSVQNTKMLSFYLNLDVRILRFMVLIRYWAKFNHLTGSNHIKNYALTLLVLVYLTRKGYVPPVELLQKLKAEERKKLRGSRNPDEIDGWDAAFCDNISVIKQHFKAVPLPSPDNSKNNNYITQAQTLIRMAIEFFEIYANLDFSKFVVCPLLGDIIPKEKFHPGNEESLPSTLDGYKNWAVKQAVNRRLNVKTCLCVQDPFVLSFNVGGVTPQGTLLKFQISCAKSLEVIRHKNGLTSLLDVLVPLPVHIGEKKFMKTYKTDIMGQELRREIKTSVWGLEAAPVKKGEKTSQSSSQTCSFVQLPPHLKSFEKFIDEKGLKIETKRPQWEIFMDFTLGSQFEDLLVSELARCQVPAKKRSNLMDALCTLWQQFALDFLNDIFGKGLKLTVAKRNGVSMKPYHDEVDGADGSKSNRSEDGKRKRWKVKILNKQEEEKLLLQTTTIAPRSREDGEKLSLKISELPVTPGVIHYNVTSYKVTYPFWEKRPMTLEKVGKEIKREEKILIPVIPNVRKMKKGKNGQEKRNRKNKREVSADGIKNGYWESFNPVDLEAKVSEILADKFNTKKGNDEYRDFKEFQINVLVKFDLSSVADKPEIFFLFEKDPSSKCNLVDYTRAVECIGKILTDAFPSYQTYRLASWLGMPPPPENGTKINIGNSSGAASRCGTENKEKGKDEQEKVGIAGSSNDNVNDTTSKKKSTRSKLEEDLLIPSSSSSTCSDDENGGLEDISNDDDDGESNNETDEEDQDQSDNSGGESNGEEEEEENKASVSATNK